MSPPTPRDWWILVLIFGDPASAPSLLGQTLYCMSSGRGLPPTKAKGARESLKERKVITSLLAFSS